MSAVAVAAAGAAPTVAGIAVVAVAAAELLLQLLVVPSMTLDPSLDPGD